MKLILVAKAPFRKSQITASTNDNDGFLKLYAGNKEPKKTMSE